ncbi:MAG: hypothetical protein KatS3mg131_1334 [Candidatus Tectimicrobiota bacterium]|nr:MAG: hypothetical protein KatS3mg131_1334 [Candidatus Tectomicrobia bacterium]
MLVGGLCGLLSVYVVLRRMSYIGHGLAHAVFGGAVASYALHLDFYLGAGLWGGLVVLAIDGIAAQRRLHADAAIGVVTTASFAFGVALMSRMRRFVRDFEAVLFGNVLGVSARDLVVIAAVTACTVAALAVLHKPLLLSTVSEDVAQVAGVPTRRVRRGFAVVLALAMLAALQVLGVTLVAAGLVIPAATARLLTHSIATMLWLSPLLGALAALVGMYLSYYLDVASGAGIVLVATLGFAVALAWRRATAP